MNLRDIGGAGGDGEPEVPVGGGRERGKAGGERRVAKLQRLLDPGLRADAGALVGHRGQDVETIGEPGCIKRKTHRQRRGPGTEIDVGARLQVRRIVNQSIGSGGRDAQVRRSGEDGLDLRRRPAGRIGVNQETVGIEAPWEQVGGVGAVGGLQGGSIVDVVLQGLKQRGDVRAGLRVGHSHRHWYAVGFDERDLQPVISARIVAGLHQVVPISGGIQKRGLRLRGERGEGRGRANRRAGQKRDLAAQRGHIR